LLGDLGGNDADLEVIEVQNGEYLEEDDIVRLEDIWERE
jgi:mannose-6-phosphate isomerase-like protein (cupin superfamily)